MAKHMTLNACVSKRPFWNGARGRLESGPRGVPKNQRLLTGSIMTNDQVQDRVLMMAADESSDRRFWITLSRLCVPVAAWAVFSVPTLWLAYPGFGNLVIWYFVVGSGWSVVACLLAPLVAPRDSKVRMFLAAVGIHFLCLVFSLIWAGFSQFVSM